MSEPYAVYFQALRMARAGAVETAEGAMDAGIPTDMALEGGWSVWRDRDDAEILDSLTGSELAAVRGAFDRFLADALAMP